MSLIGGARAPAGSSGGSGASKASNFVKADTEGESGPDNLRSGTHVWATFRDGSERRAVVVERRAGEDGRFSYYVHYHDLNRRMDTWKRGDELRYDAEVDAAAKAVRADPEREAARKAGGEGGEGKSGSGAHGGGHAHREGDDRELVDTDGTILKVRTSAGGDAVVENVEPEHLTAGLTDAQLLEHEEVTKVKNVNSVQIGPHVMDTWYFSPLPKEYWADGFLETLFYCEFCLAFFKSKPALLHHATKCTCKAPPGDEIYRGSDGVAFFEVDGAKDKVYCQNLCYLAKLFLDHKTLYYDTDVFFFYVMCTLDERGYHIVGYFSKEKLSDPGYNLACILALPCHQKRGYGRMLIQFSYELSKKEGKLGSPEKPLSDLGLLSYRSYWAWQTMGVLRAFPSGEISILDIAKATAIKVEDIVSTLQHLGFLRFYAGGYAIAAPVDVVEREFKRHAERPGPVVEPARLHWAPPNLNKRDRWLVAGKGLEQGT